MEMQVFLVCMSVAMLTLTVVLIVLLIMLSKSLAAAAGTLRSIERGLQPMLEDIHLVSANIAQASEGIKNSVEKINRLAGALGGFGDDLETGRRALKSAAGTALNTVQPWLAKLKMFKSNFFNSTLPRKEIRYE